MLEAARSTRSQLRRMRMCFFLRRHVLHAQRVNYQNILAHARYHMFIRLDHETFSCAVDTIVEMKSIHAITAALPADCEMSVIFAGILHAGII